MKNKQFILSDKENFSMKTIVMPKLKPEYVRVRFIYCGICGGDYSCYIGRRCQYPYSLGHEFVAIVEKVGKSVASFAIGDHVISDFNYRCGICNECKKGLSHLCQYNDNALFSNRAFAKYSDIHYSYLHKINIIKNLVSATLIEPLSCVIHAFNIALKYKNIQSITIIGLGNIGMLFSFYAKLVLGISDVKVFDINKQRENAIIKLMNCKKYDPAKSMFSDIIIDATNTIEGVKFSLNNCKKNQLLCVMSHLYGINTSIIYEEICKKEIFPIFPLRNGNIENLSIAETYIIKYWKTLFNDMIGIFPINNINEIFNNKLKYPSNKQVLDISSI